MPSHCYTHTSAGRIKTRTWVRGVATTYGVAWGGRHTATVSGAVSMVFDFYNRLGQVTFKTDAAGSVDRTFTPGGRLLTETNEAGILGGDDSHPQLRRSSSPNRLPRDDGKQPPYCRFRIRRDFAAHLGQFGR